MVDPLAASTVVARLRAAGCVFAEDEAALLRSAAHTAAELAGMLDRRCGGEPLEVLLGWAEFRGRRTAVSPGVFVPRRRSELLVETAAKLSRPDAVVVELCCGSGAIGAALLWELGRAELHAADIDPAAVRCARANLEATGAHVYEGDLYEPLPTALRGHVDILVANAPYVPSGSIALMPPEAREHEPTVALDGGPDGVEVQRRIAACAGHWLAPSGHLLIETTVEQSPTTAEAMRTHGLFARVVHRGDIDATVVIGSAQPGFPAG